MCGSDCDLTFSRWFRWASAFAKAARADLTATPYRVDEEGQALLWRDEIIYSRNGNGSLLAVAEWYVTRDWTERLRDKYVVVHAATLEWHGEALLLVGGPGAGKSSLAVELVGRGFRYLGDEFAIINPGDLRVLPLPTAARLGIESPEGRRLSMPGFRVLYSGGRDPVGGCVKSACCIPNEDVVPLPGESFRIKNVFFLDADRPEVPAGQEDLKSVVRLVRACWHPTPEALHTVAGLAREAKAFALDRTALHKMAERVESSVERVRS